MEIGQLIMLNKFQLNYDCTKIMDQVLANKGNAVFKVFDGEYSMEFRDYVKKKICQNKSYKT